MLEVGDKAPAFVGRDQQGREVRSSELLARGPVVLYFYPKDFTPGCTQQACLFRDVFADLDARGASIVGVSLDDQASHRRFSDTHGLPFALLSDTDKAIAKRFDVGRFFGLMLKRVTYVIDRDGTIRGVFHHELSVNRHIEDTLRALDALG